MKTFKASLLLPLLTMLFSLALSGCYTQLAFVDDENYSAIEPSPIIIYPPIIVEPAPHPIWPIGPRPPIDPPTHPVFDPLPPAGSSPFVTEQPSQSPQRRESGYQRSDRSEERQTTSSDSDKRTSGSMRGGR